MKWSEISILTTNEAIEPVSNILHESGACGVVIEDPMELIKEREDVFGEIYQLDLRIIRMKVYWSKPICR